MRDGWSEAIRNDFDKTWNNEYNDFWRWYWRPNGALPLQRLLNSLLYLSYPSRLADEEPVSTFKWQMYSSKKAVMLFVGVISTCSTLLVHRHLELRHVDFDAARTLGKDTSRPDTKHTCPSLHQQQNKDNEHSPLLFKEHSLLICRTPKVGSLELRGIAAAQGQDKPFEVPELNRPLYGRNTRRYHWCRWVSSLFTWRECDAYSFCATSCPSNLVGLSRSGALSSFLEDYSQHEAKPRYDAASLSHMDIKWSISQVLWVKLQCKLNSIFLESGCSAFWAPPHYCRCGIHDCRVDWEVYKVEEHSIGSVLKLHLPQQYLPLGTNTSLHKRRYRRRDYLTPDLLTMLNEATREEQDFFDYKPFTLEDL